MYHLNRMISKTFRKNTTNGTKVVSLEADDQKDVDKYSRTRDVKADADDQQAPWSPWL